MSAITIRMKIAAGSALIGILFLLLAIAAILSSRENSALLQRIQYSYSELDSVLLPLATTTLNIKIDITQVQQFLTDMSATRGLDGLNEGTAEAEQYARAFQRDVSEAHRLVDQLENAELRVALDDVASAFEPYFDLGKKMTAAYVTSGPAGGNVLMPKFDAQADSLRKALDRVIELVGSASTSRRSATASSLGGLGSTIDRDFHIALALASMALCLAVGLAVIMRSSVSRPIVELSRSMSELATGALNNVIPLTTSKDEIGEMARAVDVFRKNAIERDRLARETRLLSGLNEWLQSAKCEDELYSMIAEVLGRLLPNCVGSLYIYANSRDVLECAKVWRGSQNVSTMHPDDCWGLRRGRVYSHGNGEIEFRCSHVSPEAADDYSCIPILAHGETVGLLHLAFVNKDELDGDAAKAIFAEQRRLGFSCAEHISLAIANVKLRDQLRDQSIRDVLTGLYNRRYLLDTCRREFQRAARSGHSVSLLSLDVDHFKNFNDNHGHDAGDTVLRALGEVMRNLFRDDDVPCRFGGEEFVVILPSCTQENAALRAEELRRKVEGIVVRYADGNLPRVTISIGVASFPEFGNSPMEVLKAADDALYVAKRDGRNRVYVSGRLPETFEMQDEQRHAALSASDAEDLRSVDAHKNRMVPQQNMTSDVFHEPCCNAA